MIDLTNKALPNTIMVNGSAFIINTDFRIWLRFAIDYEKWDKKGGIQIDYLFIDKIPEISTEDAWSSLIQFLYPRNELPRSTGNSSVKAMDYELDSDLIYDAFLQEYDIDLLETDMHWWKFLALQNGLTNKCKLVQVIGYRCYEGKDKEMQKLQSAWELPEVLTDEELEQEREFDELFG